MKEILKGLIVSAAAIGVGMALGLLYNKAPEIAGFLEDAQNESFEAVTPKITQLGLGPVVSSSGVLIRPDLVLSVGVTPLDFIFDAKINVTFKDGTSRDATLEKFDHRSKLALLKISPVVFPTVNPGDPVLKGDKVTMVGHAFGSMFTVKSGEVVGFRKLGTSRARNKFLVNAQTLSGMSGGPVFDAQGNFVGLIASSGVYCHCISLEEIASFLDEEDEEDLTL